MDGPHQGDAYALELRGHEQVTIPTTDGRRAVYEYENREFLDDLGYTDKFVRGLWFVGYELDQ